MKTKARDHLHNWVYFPPKSKMTPDKRIEAIALSVSEALFENDYVNHGYDEDRVRSEFRYLIFNYNILLTNILGRRPLWRTDAYQQSRSTGLHSGSVLPRERYRHKAPNKFFFKILSVGCTGRHHRDSKLHYLLILCTHSSHYTGTQCH